MPYIDKDAVKERVSFATAIEHLRLDMRRDKRPGQFRGACPVCGGDRVLTYGLNADGDEAFTCHASGAAGDVISLVMHIRGVRFKEALAELAEIAGVGTSTSKYGSTSTSRGAGPESERRKPPVRERGGGHQPPLQSSRFDPERYAASLDYEHELLIEAGGDPERLRLFGIGYCSKGIHRGRIAVRVSDPETGEEVFLSVEGTIHLPPQLKTNVIPLRKQA